MASPVRDHTAPEPFVTTDDAGHALWSVGALMVIKATATTTGGAFALIDHLAGPGYETPYHVHHAEDEFFYVLSGAIECFSGAHGGEVVRVQTHDTVFLPRDIPHGFRVVSDEPCRMLIGLTPGGLEAFYIAAGEDAGAQDVPPSAEPDIAALTALASNYDLEILGALPGSR
jgi:quercetin dioxygenase-like cupin family protein